MITVFNTLSGRKERFEPLTRGHVRMYVCGVTAYDYCHVGHARSAIVFDAIRRYLQRKGYTVTYVKNFTDVDDKIIHRAQERGLDWKDIATRYIEEYEKDMERLKVGKADREPRATEYIPEMIEIVSGLLSRGYAYEKGGDVFFEIERFPSYGKLSKRRKEELVAGVRIDVDERKRNPLDFVLWKSSKTGEPSWESPWGPGRPGWHIECSAMAMACLGQTFDIHGGGMDLVFPHHENEIAQSEAWTGKEFVRFWLHNGFVERDQQKMSKSLGNFFTIREIFEESQYPSQVTSEVLRYLLLSSHYRSPLDFSDDALRAAKASLDSLYILFQKFEELKGGQAEEKVGHIVESVAQCEKRIEEALDDDFNTPEAIGELHKLRAEINKWMESGSGTVILHNALSPFKKVGEILGLFSLSPSEWVTGKMVLSSLSEEEIQTLVAERTEARRTSRWKKADEIRERLTRHGIIIEDRPDGTTRIRK